VEPHCDAPLKIITTPCAAFKGSFVYDSVVSCCECFGQEKNRPPDLFRGPTSFRIFSCSILLWVLLWFCCNSRSIFGVRLTTPMPRTSR